MVLNKKGQSIFFLFMIAIVLFILGFALAPALVTSSSSVTSTLGCSNQSIEAYQKVHCGVIDIVAPWITGLILGLGGMAFAAKIL